MSIIDSFSLSSQSVQELCPGPRAMVYGFKHCKYIEVRRFLSEFFQKKIFTEQFESPEFHVYGPIRDGKVQQHLAKIALTDMIFENFLRTLGKCTQAHSQGPIIPVIFCIDIDKNPFPLTSENLCAKKPKLNKLITHSELRRVYKLCYDPSIDERIREVAKKSFIFVKLVKSISGKENEYDLQRVPAPWENTEFGKQFEKRKLQSASRALTTWRDLLYNGLDEFHIPLNPNKRAASSIDLETPKTKRYFSFF